MTKSKKERDGEMRKKERDRKTKRERHRERYTERYFNPALFD